MIPGRGSNLWCYNHGFKPSSFFLCVSSVTIISGVIMLILFVSELQYYLTKEVSISSFFFRSFCTHLSGVREDQANRSADVSPSRDNKGQYAIE